MYDALVYYYEKQMTSGECRSARKKPFELANYFLQIVAAEWHNVFQIIQSELGRLYFDLETDQSLLTQPDHWFRLNVFSRQCQRYSYFLKYTLSMCMQGGPQRWTSVEEKGNEQTEKKDEGLIDRTRDFQHLLLVSDVMIGRIEKQLNTLIATISAELGRQAANDTDTVTRLTIAAFIFLPLSLVASLMSLGGTFALDGSKPWLYWAVAIPFAAIVFRLGYNPSRTRKAVRIQHKRDELDSLMWHEGYNN